MKFKWIYLLLLIVFLNSCQNDTTTTSGGYTLTLNSIPDTLFTHTAPNSAEVTAMLINDNYPVSGVEIQFAADTGELTSSAITNNNGIATSIYQANTAQQGTATIIASYEDIEATTEITIISSGVTLTLISSAETLFVGSGVNSCQITAIYTENDQPVQDAQVFFTANLGEITTFNTTDQNGMAIATYLNSNLDTGIVNISATCNGLEAFTNIMLDLDPALQMNISTTADTLFLGSGINSCLIRAELTRNGTPVAGAPVSFTSDIGSITASDITDNDGIAESIFIYDGSEPAIATCQVAFSSLQDEIVINIVEDAIYDLEVWADPNMIFLNSGNYDTDVFASLTDHDGNPISDAVINFEVSSGFIPSSSITNSQGLAQVVYVFSGDEEEIIQITATYQNQSAIGYIYALQPELELIAWAEPDTIYQGTSANYADIYAQLTTEFGSPITGVQINFSTTVGSILGYGSTNSQGIANTTFWYSERPDIIANITATYQGLSANTSVTILEDQLEIVALEADPLIIYADNDPETYSTVRARVYDSAGLPVEDAIVTFETNLGYMTLDTAQTNFSGWATNMLHDNGVSGVATIYITCDNDYSQIDVQIIDE